MGGGGGRMSAAEVVNVQDRAEPLMTCNLSGTGMENISLLYFKVTSLVLI